MAQLETAPTKQGERKCLHILIIHYKCPYKEMRDERSYFVPFLYNSNLAFGLTEISYNAILFGREGWYDATVV